MSEFKDLIKRFPKTREYVRDFFVYGFKTRDEFKSKSTRTYDNERRRIESWLGDFVQQDYTSKGKNISLAIDSNLLDTNPLYSVWKTKSFTDNDIMLHFFLLDLLPEKIEYNNVDTPSEPTNYTIEKITDDILFNYNVYFDPQMVRRKCNTYVKEGLLHKEKIGKDLVYFKSQNINDILDKYPTLKNAFDFYQLVSPLGFACNTIQDNIGSCNRTFRVKHSFLVYTLEDEILLSILTAIQNKRAIEISIMGSKTNAIHTATGAPLRIFVSTRTGRRFVCLHLTDKKVFSSYRLDTIKSVQELNIIDNYDSLRDSLANNYTHLWGVSFRNTGTKRLEKVKLTLHINEYTEMFILERLEREGRGGSITKIAPDTFVYEKEVFDSNEMLPWIRTFIGRILDLECESERMQTLFQNDLEKMYKLYDICSEPSKFIKSKR